MAGPDGLNGSDTPAPPAPKLSVVVPAFHEAEIIGSTVEEITATLTGALGHDAFEVIVVDDGSEDDTAGVARLAGAEVVALRPNRGKGAAVRAGVLAARGEVIAFTDADLSYTPANVLHVYEAVRRGAGMAIGSRAHADSHVVVHPTLFRTLSSRVFNVLARSLLQGTYNDTQSGLKAFPHDVARRLFERQRLDGFAFDVELFFLAARFGVPIVEVPVTVAHTRRSSVRVGVDAARMARDVVRVRRWARQGVYDA